MLWAGGSLFPGVGGPVADRVRCLAACLTGKAVCMAFVHAGSAPAVGRRVFRSVVNDLVGIGMVRLRVHSCTCGGWRVDLNEILLCANMRSGTVADRVAGLAVGVRSWRLWPGACI
jgi:hypothetical protein